MAGIVIMPLSKKPASNKLRRSSLKPSSYPRPKNSRTAPTMTRIRA